MVQAELLISFQQHWVNTHYFWVHWSIRQINWDTNFRYALIYILMGIGHILNDFIVLVTSFFWVNVTVRQP